MDLRDFDADKVRKLIADYLKIDVNRVIDEAHLSDDLGVDWLDQLELLIIIEDEFADVQFSDGAAIDVVGDLIRFIETTVQQARGSSRSAILAYRRSAALTQSLILLLLMELGSKFAMTVTSQ
jgi:acyl carrier protein